jgi:hypothetical protein
MIFDDKKKAVSATDAADNDDKPPLSPTAEVHGKKKGNPSDPDAADNNNKPPSMVISDLVQMMQKRFAGIAV